MAYGPVVATRCDRRPTALRGISSTACQPSGVPGRILPVAVTLEAERPRRAIPGSVADTDDQSDTATASITIDLLFEEAFEDLYVRAYGVAYQLLGRRSEAEDVAQETMARAFVRWRTIRSYAEAWGVRVAGNRASDGWRRRQRSRDRRRGGQPRGDSTRSRRPAGRRPPRARHPVTTPARGDRVAVPRRPPGSRSGQGPRLLGRIGEAARQPGPRNSSHVDGRR